MNETNNSIVNATINGVVSSYEVKEAVKNAVLSINTRAMKADSIADIEDKLNKLIDAINILNNKPRFDESFVVADGEFRFSAKYEEYKVPDYLTFLVAPKSVTVNGQDTAKDFRIRDEEIAKMEMTVTPDEFQEYVTRINGFLGISVSTTSFAQLRSGITLAAALDSFAISDEGGLSTVEGEFTKLPVLLESCVVDSTLYSFNLTKSMLLSKISLFVTKACKSQKASESKNRFQKKEVKKDAVSAGKAE